MKKTDVTKNPTIRDEIESSYGNTDFSNLNVAFIRVDQDHTYEVLMIERLMRTGKTMNEYLEVVSTNLKMPEEEGFVFNLESRQKSPESSCYSWDPHDISTNSEVLVAIPRMPKEDIMERKGRTSSD